MKGGGEANYIKVMVYVFLMLGAFILAIVSAYFGSVGLYFGQGIVEKDVFTDEYRYGSCITEVDGECTVWNESDVLQSFQDYEETRSDLNDTIPLYIDATTVIFALLALVFLFLALRSAGLWKKKGSGSRDEY